MTHLDAKETERVIDHLNDLTNGIGLDIRALRKSRAMTLTELAGKLGRSAGFVSQVERGMSQPSIGDLRKIAAMFDVSISFFFGHSPSDPAEARYIVRANERRRLGNSEGGLLEELLSPDLRGSFEIVRSEFLPGTALEKPIQRKSEEAGYVVSGTLDIEIEGRWHKLREGDSFRINEQPFRWRNRWKAPAILIWVISPPVY